MMMNKIIEWIFPIRLVSESNNFDHWTKKHKRKKIQKTYVTMAFVKDKPNIELPCLIKLTRIAPRALDADDNLPIAFKALKDFIADKILPGQASGRADGDDRLQWKYEQIKGKPKEYAVKIELYSI